MAKFQDEQLRAIIAGPRTHRKIPFPGGGENGPMIAVRALTEGEGEQCKLEAQDKLRRFCKQRGWDPTTMVDMDPSVLLREQERQLILMAFYDPDTTEPGKRPERFFATIGDVATFAAAIVDTAAGTPRGRLTTALVTEFATTAAAPNTTWRLGWDTPSATPGVRMPGPWVITSTSSTVYSGWLSSTRRGFMSSGPVVVMALYRTVARRLGAFDAL